MPKVQTSYEISDEDLVRRFSEACVRTGVSNSGLCISPGADDDAVHARYLKGVVLARLAGKKPPYEPSQRVVVTRDGLQGSSYRLPILAAGSQYTIEKVWYTENNWYLELKGIAAAEILSPIYPASGFKLVTETAAVS